MLLKPYTLNKVNVIFYLSIFVMNFLLLIIIIVNIILVVLNIDQLLYL